jgi:hypothetical protein
MAKLRSVLGYLAAALTVPLITATFMGIPFWSERLVSVTGVTVSPWFTGGEVARTVDHGAYRTEIHQPVYDALIGERRRGSVQVDWTPPESLPHQLDEEIDFDGDGQADFRVQLETQSAQALVTPYTSDVLELEDVYQLPEALAIRVRVVNPRRR